MRLSVFPCLAVFFVSCSNNGSNPFADSDSLVIRFRVSSTVKEKIITTTNKTAIKKVADFLDSKTVAEANCPHDGLLSFYSNNILKGVALFNYSNDSCMFFRPAGKDRVQPVKMSDEARDFLKRLAGGKNWY